MNKSGEDDSLFVLSESVIPAASNGGIGPLVFDGNNCFDGEEANDAPILLSGRTLSLRSEDMVELCRQGISIDDDNDTAPENVPRQGETNIGTVNLRREGIICPRKPGNLQSYFASFRHNSHVAILRLSMLQLLLIMFPGTILRKYLFPRPTRV